MSGLTNPVVRVSYVREWTWSQGEKRVARKAFQRSLQQELDKVIRQAKEIAGKMEEPSDVWELEEFLTRRRHQIDREFDYRYSVLPDVFVTLIGNGLLSESELEGLSADKLEYIRQRLECLNRKVFEMRKTAP